MDGNRMGNLKALFGLFNNGATLIDGEVFVAIIGQTIDATGIIMIANAALKAYKRAAAVIIKGAFKPTFINIGI